MPIFVNVRTDTFTPSNSSISVSTLSKKGSLATRIAYFKSINKYIKSQANYDPNNCFKFDDNIIAIGNDDNKKNRIILDKKIGNVSKYGIVFLSHFKHANGKISTFTTKIVDSSKNYNHIEAYVLQKLTELNVRKKICPNFPICYGVLQCDNLFKEQYNVSLNQLNYKRLLFTFNELADNDLATLLNSRNYTSKILLNALSQIFMAIMFFNKYIEAYHRDSHAGNFLYHKIKPGGYFHYNINGTDYYIENLGYLWVIWDFGLIIPFKKLNYPNNEKHLYDKKIPINHDYIYILLKGFINTKIPVITIIFENIYAKYNNVYDVNKMPFLITDILNTLVKYTEGCFLTSLPAKHSKIINRIPYKY
jgi:hypothetical protein